MNQMTRNYGRFVLLVGPCDYKLRGYPAPHEVP